MADNVAITPGIGATIACDEVVDGTLGTVKVQYVKIMDATLDGTTKAAVGAAGLKVDGSGATQPVSGTVTVTGTVAATQSGTFTVQPGNTANTTAWKVDNTAALDKGSGTGGTATQRMILDSAQVLTPGQATMANSQPVVPASDWVGTIGGKTVTQAASSTITRPADTTTYASGDLVANSVTAGSVTNLQFTTLARVSGGSGLIVGAQIQKSTAANISTAAFRLHLFNTAPTYTSAGDNTAISTVVVASAKGYLGYVDITAMVAFSDVAWGSGAPDNTRGSIPYVATAQIIYGLLEARGAYPPGNAEVFTVTLDALQD